MSHYSKKPHSTSTFSLPVLKKYAYKYKDTLSISPNQSVHNKTNYLKVIRKVKTDYGSFQKLQNPFSPTSCSTSAAQYLKLLKKHSKTIQSAQSHQILCNKPHFQRVIASFPLKSIVIDTIHDSGFQLLLQSRFCQTLKIIHKQPYFPLSQPVCLHTLKKILSDTPRRNRVQLPAALLAHQAAGRRLSFEPDNEQEDLNDADAGVNPLPGLNTQPPLANGATTIDLQKAIESTSMNLARKNLARFSYRGLKLKTLKKMVIEIHVTSGSLYFLKSLNQGLQRRGGNLELEIYVKGAQSLSNGEKNELLRLKEIWKRTSLLSFDLKGKEVSTLELLKPISEMLRNLKKLEVKLAHVDQENSQYYLESLSCLPSNLLDISLAIKQARYNEAALLVEALRLPRGLKNLKVRFSESCKSFWSGFSSSDSPNIQYKSFYKVLAEKLEDVSDGNLEVKIKDKQPNRITNGVSSIGKRQRASDTNGTHYLETPRKRGVF